jgi:hypothetical protein
MWVVSRALELISGYGEAITALATVVIAYFTRTLYRATRKQGVIAQRSIELARADFLANQRPKLHVRNIVVHRYPRRQIPPVPLFQGGSTVSGQLYVSNVGGTPATLREYLILVYWSQDELPMERPYEGEDGVKSETRIEPGTSRTLLFESKEWMEVGAGAAIRSGDGAWKLWVMGWVEYDDDLKVTRRTAFCRRFDKRVQRINIVEDNDYDHEE